MQRRPLHIEALGAEHQPVHAGMRLGIGDIGLGPGQRFLKPGAAARPGRGHRDVELPEPDRRKFADETSEVAEMMGGRGMRHPGFARHRTQRQSRHSLAFEHPLRCLEQRVVQSAMMVRSHHRPPPSHGLGSQGLGRQGLGSQGFGRQRFGRLPRTPRCGTADAAIARFFRHASLIVRHFYTVKISLDCLDDPRYLYLYDVKISKGRSMQQEAVTTAARTNLAPIPMECDAPHLKIEGELPRELNGTLYRNGPNPQFEAPGAHWFVGDGMLHAFHLENGRASYRNRWIRTPKWQAEHDAGRALFGGFGQRLPGAPASTPTDGGVANTNIIFHAGRLLALEEGHLPTEIEPGTLNRLGYCDYKGGIAGPFTAHPKIDPVTGEMVFFGYNAAGPLTPALSFGSVNASGVVTRFDRFEAPYASMVHDFIVTENHLLFPILPITGSMERAMRGRPPYAWEPEKGAYVGVMKRNGAAKDIVWFRAENCYVFHV